MKKCKLCGKNDSTVKEERCSKCNKEGCQWCITYHPIKGVELCEKCWEEVSNECASCKIKKD